MANFLALLDGDSLRRQRVIDAARGLIAPVAGLRTDALHFGELDLIWAAGTRAPVSTACTDSGAAVIWGDAIPGPGPARLDAAGLLSAWAPDRGSIPEPCDGFYAALRFDGNGHLTIGADLLGLFPVYYASRDGILIAGSSAELFGLHPLFPPRLGLEGLIGLLLAHAPLDGRALLDGVRRLAPGHLLRWRPEGNRPEEVRQYAAPYTDAPAIGSFEEQVARLDAARLAAIERQVPPGETVGMLLSGGRDSRLLAGYLDRHGVHPPALTFGAPGDYEVRCAKAVARELGLVQHRADVPFEAYPAAAQLQARWEQLGAGFSTIHTWGQIGSLLVLPARFCTGYLYGFNELEPHPNTFAESRTSAQSRGFPLGLLRRLLRPGRLGELADRLHARMEEVFDAAPAQQRGWRFALAHERRCHAGGVPWRLSFGSWPVLPVLDRNLLETLAMLPDSTLDNRRAQDHLLRTRFPRLARLPFDRNTLRPMPLSPSLLWRARGRLYRLGDRIGRLWPARPAATRERRYYSRTYDLNNPGWQAVRRLAEPHREQLTELFDPDALAELLPPPGRRIESTPLAAATFRPKLLLGLMLWYGRGSALPLPLDPR